MIYIMDVFLSLIFLKKRYRCFSERLGDEGEMLELSSSVNADCDIIGRVGSISV